MPKKTKKRSKKTGLPAGSLVYIGEKSNEQAKVSLLAYDESGVIRKEYHAMDKSLSHAQSKVNWINIEGVHDVDLIAKVGTIFDIHPLLLEDIMNTEQRPKFEAFDDYIHIVVKMLSYDDKTEDVAAEQVSLILTEHFVISFQDGLAGDIFDPIREQIGNEKSRLRKSGTDYLLYALTDIIVDNYFVILEKIGDRIEDLEEAIITNPKPEIIIAINKLKREMILLRKSVWPLREIISGLERSGTKLIQESTGKYLRDVYDHSIQVIDTIETYRDLLSGMLDMYLTNISNRMNEIMKVLTIITTIFMPLSFLAGLYGMNFKHMPELELVWGYPALLILMASIAIAMLMYFRKKKWL